MPWRAFAFAQDRHTKAAMLLPFCVSVGPVLDVVVVDCNNLTDLQVFDSLEGPFSMAVDFVFSDCVDNNPLVLFVLTPSLKGAFDSKFCSGSGVWQRLG